MDAKLTLSLNKEVVAKAKKYAEANNISVSRLVEFLLNQITAKNYKSLDDYPISDWVTMVAEGEAAYIHHAKKSRKALKEEYFSTKK